jgi:hypothetical protein
VSTPVIVWIIQAHMPWKPVEQYLAILKTTKTATWAVVPRLNGARRKVGASAFLTSEAAEKRRLGMCAAVLQPHRVKMLERKGYHTVVDAAARQLPPRVFVRQMAT